MENIMDVITRNILEYMMPIKEKRIIDNIVYLSCMYVSMI